MNKEIYCIRCGKMNSSNEKICFSCEKSLDYKHIDLKNFLIKNIRNKTKEQISDKVFSLIRDFLIAHLFGIVLTVSIVFTASTLTQYFIEKAGDTTPEYIGIVQSATRPIIEEETVAEKVEEVEEAEVVEEIELEPADIEVVFPDNFFEISVLGVPFAEVKNMDSFAETYGYEISESDVNNGSRFCVIESDSYGIFLTELMEITDRNELIVDCNGQNGAVGTAIKTPYPIGTPMDEITAIIPNYEALEDAHDPYTELVFDSNFGRGRYRLVFGDDGRTHQMFDFDEMDIITIGYEFISGKETFSYAYKKIE